MQPSLHIITFATDSARTKNLRRSAEMHDVLSCLSIHMENSWYAYRQKLYGLRKELAKITDETAVVCFIDAYDVIISGSPKEILAKFAAYDADLVIGAEMNCFPEAYKEEYDKAFTPVRTNDVGTGIQYLSHKYVNSGGYIGTKAAIERFLDFFTSEEADRICDTEGGDQALLMKYFIKQNNNPRIKLDQECKIFWNMHMVHWDDLRIVGGRIYNIPYDVWPCLVHFNGGSFQTQGRVDIMPIVVQRMEQTRESGEQAAATLSDYKQIVTATCVPKSQFNYVM